MANRNGNDAARSRGERQSGGPDPSGNAGGSAAPGSLGDAGQGPSTTGGLASGYSSHSGNGGTGGDILKQKGSGYSPGADSREGAYENEADPLAREGVTGGAAGQEPSARALDRVPMSGREEEEYASRGAAVTSGQDATGDAGATRGGPRRTAGGDGSNDAPARSGATPARPPSRRGS
jgi:hypothetical protein